MKKLFSSLIASILMLATGTALANPSMEEFLDTLETQQVENETVVA